MTTASDIERHLPLTPLAFEIMLALTDGERHGYAIMRAVEERTSTSALHPGTLYRAIGRLVDAGMLEELEERPDPDTDDDRRRAYYRLTRFGRRVATAEAERLAGQVMEARARKLLKRA